MKTINREQIILDSRLIQYIDHPFILKLLCAFHDPLEKLCYFVFEYPDGGDVITVLEHQTKVDESIAQTWIAEVIVAIQYLTEAGFYVK